MTSNLSTVAKPRTIKHATKAKAKAKTKHKPKVKSKHKATPTCTAKDLRTKASKRRKCVVPKKTIAATNTGGTQTAPVVASPTGPVAAPPATSSVPGSFPTASPTPAVDGLRTYSGPFGTAQAQRLLFRAGFGPTPGQAEAVAALGVTGAVDQLMSPGPATLVGPAPSGNYLVDGLLAPRDLYGHEHLDMLDRQVRSTDSLTERMTLVLHDWFAVIQGSVDGGYFPDHIALLRSSWRGSFRTLLLNVTQDKSMLQFLNGIDNHMGAPNENYARELMELFTLGADRGAYTETDVREMARALTGFYHDWQTDQIGYDVTLHDSGTKTVFAGTSYQRTGNLDWHDAVNAVVDHPLHPSFVVRKLWSYFIPTEPTPVTQQQLEDLYRSSGEALEPLVRAILLHPDLHAGACMVKPPVVLTSGLLRALGRTIDTDAWVSRDSDAGQLLGYPPNVSGWNDRAWLNTSTYSARWEVVAQALRPTIVGAAVYAGKTETPEAAVAKALAFFGNPVLTADHLAALNRAAQSPRSASTTTDKDFLAQRQNVLRQLIGAAPDFQVS